MHARARSADKALVSYRLCGIHVVAEAMNPLGEEVPPLLALEVLGRDEGSLHGAAKGVDVG